MKLSYRILHYARILNSILFWPVLALVVWGELGTFAPGGGFPLPDKVVHFIAYFTLATMAAAAFRERRHALYAVLIIIALGGLLEIVQDYVGRNQSLYDQFANTAGALTGGTIGRLIVEPLRRRYPAWT